MKKFFLLSCVATLFVTSVVFAASSAKVYYNSSLSKGRTDTIKNRLNSMGYSSSRSSDPSISTVKSAFGSNAVVHILTHGGAGVLVCSNGNLTANAVSSYYGSSGLSGTKLIFLEACEAGRSSSTDGHFPSVFSNKGAKSSVSFTTTISASSDTNGIHYFSEQVYYYLQNSYSVSDAVKYAKTATYGLYGKYYGAESVTVYGGSTKIY